MSPRKMPVALVKERHRKAMALAAEADELKRLGRRLDARILLEDAFETEFALLSEHSLEPSYSVLVESAASLGLECGRFLAVQLLTSDYCHRCGVGEIRARVMKIGKEAADILELTEDIEIALLDALQNLPDEFRTLLTGAYSLDSVLAAVDEQSDSTMIGDEQAARANFGRELEKSLERHSLTPTALARIRSVFSV